jgi:lysophospholipase L1-like esterase
VVFENVQVDKNLIEIYGVNIQSSDNNGLVYHNAGVGGANYGAIPAQSYFETQLGILKPSVVVLDYGTNDILYKNQVASTLEATIINTIAKIRTAQPNALIVMMPPQDMFFKGRDITSANDLAQLLRRIAFQNNCLFYDWYRISGGRGAMKTWVSYGLGRADHIHLTEKGYALKGYLLAKAFENSVNDFNTTPPSFEFKDSDAYSVSNWLKVSSMPPPITTTTTSKVSKQVAPIKKIPSSNPKKSQATIKTN